MGAALVAWGWRRPGAMDDLQSELTELRARLSDTLERL